MKSGSMASFRAAAEIGDPPDEADLFCYYCYKKQRCPEEKNCGMFQEFLSQEKHKERT